MSSFYPPKLQPRPTGAALAADLVCHKCRTSLQGLAFDAHCSKCGVPVALSMHGDLIRYSDPKWIGRLRLGLNLSVWGFIVACVGLGMNLDAIRIVAGYVGLSGYFSFATPSPAIRSISTTVSLAGIVMELVGTWFFTTPDPCELGEKSYGKLRRGVRILLVLSLLLMATFITEVLKFGLKHIVAMTFAVAITGGLIGLTNPVLQLVYLSRLAMRIRDTLLNERAHFLARAITITSGIFVASLLLTASAYKAPAYFDDSATDCLGFVCVISEAALGVFLIMNILLLARFARRLAEQETLARQTWEQA